MSCGQRTPTRQPIERLVKASGTQDQCLLFYRVSPVPHEAVLHKRVLLDKRAHLPQGRQASRVGRFPTLLAEVQASPPSRPPQCNSTVGKQCQAEYKGCWVPSPHLHRHLARSACHCTAGAARKSFRQAASGCSESSRACSAGRCSSKTGLSRRWCMH